MSLPIAHSQATGIHPGAFVQDTAPDTSSVQNHVLWVDTSVGPPYALKLWNADSSEWLTLVALPVITTGADFRSDQAALAVLDGAVSVDAQGMTWSGLTRIDTRNGLQVYYLFDGGWKNIIDSDGDKLRLYSTDGDDAARHLVGEYFARQWKFYIDDVARLTLPFDTSTSQPTTLLAQDPSTGVPAYWPMAGVMDGLTSSHVPPSDTSTALYCGMAQAVAQTTEGFYNKGIGLINGSLISFTGLTLDQAMAELGGVLAKRLIIGEIGGPWMSLLIGALTIIEALIDIVLFTGTYIPALGATQGTALTKAVYCGFVSQDSTAITSATLAAWRDNLDLLGSEFTTGQVGVLKAMFSDPFLGYWQGQAATGAASDLCGAWTCPP